MHQPPAPLVQDEFNMLVHGACTYDDGMKHAGNVVEHEIFDNAVTFSSAGTWVGMNLISSLKVPFVASFALGCGIACSQPVDAPEQSADQAPMAQALVVEPPNGALYPCDNDFEVGRPRTVHVSSSQDLLTALQNLGDQDSITLDSGWHQIPSIRNFNPTREIKIYAAPDVLLLSELKIENSSNLTFQGVRFTKRVLLEGSSAMKFYDCTFDVQGSGAALELQGRRGANHHIQVDRCTFLGGGRTVFMNGAWVADRTKWNHTVSLTRNHITCGSNACVQIGAGRDLTFAGNVFRGASTNAQGILLAGTENVQIIGNIFEGPGGGDSVAMKIATPGWGWDPFVGVEHLITRNNVVANNVVQKWKSGIMFAAALDTEVVFNTFSQVDHTLFMLPHKPTKAANGSVLVERTAGTRAWNNIFSSSFLVIGDDEKRPAFESNNLYPTAEASGGEAPIIGDPKLAGDLKPLPGSPAINAGRVETANPTYDFALLKRDQAPDVGAHEIAGTPWGDDCRASGATFPPSQAVVHGRIGYDSNRNGRLDSGEEPGSLLLWVDENENGQFDTAQGTFVSTTSPTSIVDYQTAYADVDVALEGEIKYITAKLDLSHTFVSDLEISLISPEGQKVILFTGTGGDGDNFSGTELSDYASTNIANGTAPFVGSFRPASPLSQFRLAKAKGIWRLEVKDIAGGDTGTLNGVTLQVSTEERNTRGSLDGRYHLPVRPGRVVLRAGQGRLGPWVAAPSSGAHEINALVGAVYAADYAIFR